jgi:hypothetical protein
MPCLSKFGVIWLQVEPFIVWLLVPICSQRKLEASQEVIFPKVISIENCNIKCFFSALYIESEDFVPHWVQLGIDVVGLLTLRFRSIEF